MMSPTEYLALYEKYIAGETSPEEEEILYTHSDQFRMHVQQASLQDLKVRDRAYHHITAEIQQQQNRKKWWYAAASILFIGSLSLYFYHSRQAFNKAGSLPLTETQQSIKPARNVATLTLADGSVLTLDDQQAGKVAEESGVSITKTKDGQLIYAIHPSQSGSALAYNTISTPKGGQYQVILPDGSKVWLNAFSSIRYPTTFPAKERKVTLSGEAYFEIAKMPSSPFRVVTEKQEIEVLGTHFNISEYDQSAQVTTTVLEGLVRVNNTTASSAIPVAKILHPGQQSKLVEGESGIQVSKVDVAQVMAWKNGYFIFDDDPIAEIMAQIARWYDVEVIYQGDMRGKVFGGIYTRNKDLQELLKGLELTEAVHFKIEGRRVIVMP